jgi:hypothetical protein
MSSTILSGIIALVAGIIGAIVTLWAQRQRNLHERSLHEQTHKTELMAETTARYYLQKPEYTDRSFEHLKKRLGGFSEAELRKILVRAGAARHIRKDGSEWWRLLERDAEAYSKRSKSSNPVLDDEDI